MNNMPTTIQSCTICCPLPSIVLKGKDIPPTPCYFCCSKPYWEFQDRKHTIESKIELVYMILNKIRERIENKFTLCGREMDELYGMLAYRILGYDVEHFSTNRDKKM